MSETIFTWPDNPQNPRDLIATFFRSWGPTLAYGAADGIITMLGKHNWYFSQPTQKVTKLDELERLLQEEATPVKILPDGSVVPE